MRIICFHLNQLGDMVFSLPALKCLRDSFPDAHISSVVRPSFASLVRNTGFIDDLLLRKNGINLDKLILAKEIRAKKYDMALMFSQSAECALLSYLGGVPRRVGFIDTTFGNLLTDRVDFKHPPSTANNLNLLKYIGAKITADNYFGLVKPSSENIKKTNEKLLEFGIATDDKLIAFSPGTSSRRAVKEWTDEGFAGVGKYLIEKGYKVVIVGSVESPGIIEKASEIIDLGGKTNLDDVTAILARCKTLIAVDSGILHLCAATGVKVIGLYGPSNPKTTGPQGLGHIVIRSGIDCSPCNKTVCSKDRQCMTDITYEQVILSLDSMLAT